MKAILDKIERQMEQGLYLGASLSVYRQGQWQSFYLGTQDGERATCPDLVYDLASVSKVVGVATVMIQLLNAGQLDLNAPLKLYLPDFADPFVTLRQLLTHTSGIDPYIPNRDSLDFEGLRTAILGIRVTDQTSFHYTDINFILLGFLLEQVLGQSLDQIFRERVFIPWQMSATSFGPRREAVPTVAGVTDGEVHDPKAKVLGSHCGSAGLFSTLSDLQIFCQHYLKDDFARDLWRNYGSVEKTRTLGWNLDGDWIDHTGYTGPFVMVNRSQQKAVIFLTNRTFAYDDRPLWIEKRRELRDVIKSVLS
ncbi:CubicO group peptidase (beta-lactamase class C family) [Streptococcus rupicaprae]|uniref:CubicO group peptidase (Beta-lactamase class C family) n=1 Tax=Streptococcus rupicaprae TaxID=759619 RepID=A0ABV2FEN1_9STRE